MCYHKTAADVPLANSCTFLSLSLYCALFVVDLAAAVVSWPPPPGSRHSTVSCTKRRGESNLNTYSSNICYRLNLIAVYGLPCSCACHTKKAKVGLRMRQQAGMHSSNCFSFTKSYISMDILWVPSWQSLNVQWEVAGMEKVLSQQLLWLITVSSLTVNHRH